MIDSASIKEKARALGFDVGMSKPVGGLPLDPRTLIHLTLASLLPMTLLLTVIPLKEVLKLVHKVLL